MALLSGGRAEDHLPSGCSELVGLDGEFSFKERWSALAIDSKSHPSRTIFFMIRSVGSFV